MILNHLSQAGNFTEKDKNALLAAVQEQNKSKYDKVDRITEYQKYVNTELDSCFCKLSSNYTPVVGQYVPFEKISGSMLVEDGQITVKPGQRIQINIAISYLNTNNTNVANIIYYVKDITNNILIHRLTPYREDQHQFEYACNTNCQFTNESTNECKVALYVDSIYTSDILFKELCSLSIHEIGRQITIDPLEHANTSQGIEDAPVGHIISHMGTVAPKHYLICDGADYNIADYPYLAQHIIDNFGIVNHFGGDGETTFAVPDLRGEFLRGTGTATRDTGSGGEVGEHQEPTQLPDTYFGVGANGSSKQIGIRYDSGGADVISQNMDKAIRPTGATQYAKVAADGSGNSAALHYAITTRPTNTSVLYCIKYEPTYFMQVHSTNYIQSNVYSEEEQVVGRWIDGKPIYRKIYVTVSPTVVTNGQFADVYINISDLNVAQSIKLYGYVGTSGSTVPIPTPGAESRYFMAFVYNNNCVLGLRTNRSDWSNCPCFIAIEYTKTTDAENSFTNDMIQDYITTEPYPDEEVSNAIDALWQ